jgi:hypothetical protein
MKYQIIGRPPKKEDVREHFFAFLRQLENEGVPEVKIMFGFAWGNYIYEKDWLWETCSPAEVRYRVEEAECKKDRKIGDDDFYISVPGTNYERTYCHEADIHFSSDKPNPILQEVKNAWTKLGWKVHESFL